MKEPSGDIQADVLWYLSHKDETYFYAILCARYGHKVVVAEVQRVAGGGT